MFDPKSTSVHSLKNTYLIVSARRSKAKQTSVILSEEVAIITCCLLMAIFAILMLIVMQTISAVTWGTVTIGQLLHDKGLFQDVDEL